MTKLIQKFSFWDKVRLFLLLFGIGGEITLFVQESVPEWKVVAAVATGIAFFITYFFKDENKDDIVDFFQRKKNE